MSTSNHPGTCRCGFHGPLAAQRHECYRQLAQAILGPAAPREDFALAEAVAQHAALLPSASNISSFRPRHAA